MRFYTLHNRTVFVYKSLGNAFFSLFEWNSGKKREKLFPIWIGIRFVKIPDEIGTENQLNFLIAFIFFFALKV